MKKLLFKVFACIGITTTLLLGGGAHFGVYELHAQPLVPDYDCKELNPDGTKNAKAYGRYDLGGLLFIAHNGIKFVYGISGALALLVFVYGGFVWLLSGGEQKRVAEGSEALKASAVGILIILGSWIFINFILLTLTDKIKVSPQAVLFGKVWSSYDRDCYTIK